MCTCPLCRCLWTWIPYPQRRGGYGSANVRPSSGRRKRGQSWAMTLTLGSTNSFGPRSDLAWKLFWPRILEGGGQVYKWLCLGSCLHPACPVPQPGGNFCNNLPRAELCQVIGNTKPRSWAILGQPLFPACCPLWAQPLGTCLQTCSVLVKHCHTDGGGDPASDGGS